MKPLGVILLVLGIVALVYGGISWTRDKKVIDAGPIEVHADKRESLYIPPIAGIALVVAGTALALKR